MGTFSGAIEASVLRIALSSRLKPKAQRGETGFADRIKGHRRIDEQLHGEAELQAAHHQRRGVGVQIRSDAALGLSFLDKVAKSRPYLLMRCGEGQTQ